MNPLMSGNGCWDVIQLGRRQATGEGRLSEAWRANQSQRDDHSTKATGGTIAVGSLFDNLIDSDTVTVYNQSMSEHEPQPIRAEQQTGLTVEELAAHGQVSVRTVRFYIAEGLLPGPGSRGKAATYGEEHLLRLRLIRRLAEQRVPLAEMRDLLDRISLDEARALLAEEEQRAAARQQAEQTASPKEYVTELLSQARAARAAPLAEPPATYRPVAPPMPPPASPQQSPGLSRQHAQPWQRWELAPGVELHVRADALDRARELIERLLRAARISGKRQES
jgi:DNA-binding transcriptional MerR regulator